MVSGTEPSRTKRYGIGALLAAFGAIAAVAFSAVSASDAVLISQRNRTFSPDAVQITRGTVVRVVNDDKVTHHVYVDAPNMHFDSGEEPIGASVELRFDQPGTYDVQCAIHPTMHLYVTVK